ncbi:hypothetical protein PY32053_01252 [Paracoccus yeei]|uniref:Uncharacterized protein n=1 Tax=Paracoccus yeei TaxID=147645 RepID=A0A386UKQ6_9RHOB|nr:hypothetical protein PY32053_01252 [Paracoccus yeei]
MLHGISAGETAPLPFTGDRPCRIMLLPPGHAYHHMNG